MLVCVSVGVFLALFVVGRASAAIGLLLPSLPAV